MRGQETKQNHLLFKRIKTTKSSRKELLNNKWLNKNVETTLRKLLPGNKVADPRNLGTSVCKRSNVNGKNQLTGKELALEE